MASLRRQPDQPVILGRVAAPHGVKGWIKLQVFSETVDVTNAKTLFRLGGQWAAHERFHVQMGYQSDSRLSGGFSLKLPQNRFSPSIEYSLSSEPSGFSSIHQFALRFHL